MYLSSLIYLIFFFFSSHFPFPSELAPSNSRKGILLTATRMDFTWNLNFQLGLSSDRFCSLYVCWQSAIHRNIQCAFSWLLYSFISMATKSILSFTAQRLGLWYKLFISVFLFLSMYNNEAIMSVRLVLSWGEEAPSKSVEQYLGAGTYLTLLWTEVWGIILQKLQGNTLVNCVMSQHQEN